VDETVISGPRWLASDCYRLLTKVFGIDGDFSQTVAVAGRWCVILPPTTRTIGPLFVIHRLTRRFLVRPSGKDVRKCEVWDDKMWGFCASREWTI